jgi:hypothetical protein
MLPRNWDKSLQPRSFFTRLHGKIRSAVSIPVYLFLVVLPCYSQASSSSSRSDWDGSQWIFLMPLGMLLWGFYRVRKAKLVADIPCIPIRSVALGMVTIKGKVEPDQMVPAPVSGRPCCFFKVKIEGWDKDQNDWMPKVIDYDGPRFFLADGTGKVLIDAHYVEGLEFDPPRTAVRIVDSDVPAEAPAAPAPNDNELMQYVSTKTAFERRGEKAIGLQDAGVAPVPVEGRYQLTEWLVLPGQEYQVTGTCTENPDSRNEDDRIVICMGERESTFIISSKTDAATDLSAFGWGLIMAGALYFVIWLVVICLS